MKKCQPFFPKNGLIINFARQGYKGPHKQSDPFDPNLFDVDGFVVSNELAAKIPKSGSARFVTAANSPALAAEQNIADQLLRERLPGLKSQPFTFRVYTTREWLNKSGDAHVIVGE